jgi:hypothetical protein
VDPPLSTPPPATDGVASQSVCRNRCALTSHVTRNRAWCNSVPGRGTGRLRTVIPESASLAPSPQTLQLLMCFPAIYVHVVFPFRFQASNPQTCKTVYAFQLCSIRAACPFRCKRFDFTVLNILDE